MSRFGATILSSDGPRLTPEEKAFFRDVNPFGFILFARHIETPDQIRALCTEFREAVGRNCLITIDQEGGRVQRLRAPLAREWKPARDHVLAAKNAPRAMYLRSRLIADELRGLGIDSNCVPNLDLIFPQTHEFLLNRCYSDDPAQVAVIGQAVVQGALDGGVVPVTKHLPGHGRANLDSHFDLPRVDTPLDTLMETDFAPIRALADAPMAMTGHIVFDALDPAQPATLSTDAIRFMRDKLGLTSLLMTDDISMKALEGDLGTLSRSSIAAGCDLVLHCNDTLVERRIVADAAGEMTEAAQTRAEAAIAARKTPDEIDIPAIEAELEALLGGQVYG